MLKRPASTIHPGHASGIDQWWSWIPQFADLPLLRFGVGQDPELRQFNLDMGGITAIMQDLAKQYGGEDKYFVTGFEAGGHTVCGILFNHPEVARSAALVCLNYLGRWVDGQHILSAAKRTGLPDSKLCRNKR